MTLRSTERQIRIVECLEALYAWEREDPEWLRASMVSIGAVWEQRVWTCGILYDASDADKFVVQQLIFNDECPAPVSDLVVDVFRDFPPSFASRTYRSLTIGFGRPVGPELEPFYQALEKHGTTDIFGVNGLDPSGVGCFIGIGAPANANMSAEALLDFQRISSHLASAYRCRQRLRAAQLPAVEQAEAVALPDGTIVEARGPAQPARGSQSAHRRDPHDSERQGPEDARTRGTLAPASEGSLDPGRGRGQRPSALLAGSGESFSGARPFAAHRTRAAGRCNAQPRSHHQRDRV